MKFENQREKTFVLISCFLSLLHAVGYIWHGIKLDFNYCIIAMIVCDLLYIPIILIKRGKFLALYLVFLHLF